MRIKKSVFGSKSERRVFCALRGRWSRRFDLYPSLPLSCIVEQPESLLSRPELSFFYKTNIDYTLCEKTGRPLLSIEFDGLGHGLSRRGKYVQTRRSPDPHRNKKLQLKLRIAEQLGYALFIISYEETDRLDPSLSLTIADGIIGQALANREYRLLFRSLLDEHRQAVCSLLPDLWEFQIDRLDVGARVHSEMKYDPIAKLAWKLVHEASERGVARMWQMEFLHDPELPQCDVLKMGAEDPAALDEWIQLALNAAWVGCRVVVDTDSVAVVKTAWLRNFDNRFVAPSHIAENVALLLAFGQSLQAAYPSVLNEILEERA